LEAVPQTDQRVSENVGRTPPLERAHRDLKAAMKMHRDAPGGGGPPRREVRRRGGDDDVHDHIPMLTETLSDGIIDQLPGRFDWPVRAKCPTRTGGWQAPGGPPDADYVV
jgi:hypothetical protein